MTSRFPCATLALLALRLLAGDPAAVPETPVLSDDFEANLARWTVPEPGKDPLLLSSEYALSGRFSAYSGPPNRMACGRCEFSLPLVGRLEVSFYDDLAARKQQIAGAVGTGGELLGIVCRGGATYQYRIGTAYSDTGVARGGGWHRLAWECDGTRTEAFIDGVRVAANPDLTRIASLFIGSPWDDSTGWYDDVRAVARPAREAGPFVEAEHAVRQSVPPGNTPAQAVARSQAASGRVLSRWEGPGHAVEWTLGHGGDQPGERLLLLKYATAAAAAARELRIDAAPPQVVRFPGTGSADRWGHLAVDLGRLAPGSHTLTLTAVAGSLDLDWLACAPPPAGDPLAYAQALDRRALAEPWWRAAVARTRAAAAAAGVAMDPLDDGSLRRAPALPTPDELRRSQAAGEGSLAQVRQRVLAAEGPKLATVWRPPVWAVPPAVTPLAGEAYTRLLRYQRLVGPRVRDWPLAPGCRYHKRDGHEEWDVRQNAAVALGWAVLLRGPYDEAVAGLPRARVAADLQGALRYLALTHVSNFLPTGDGQPWGDQWQSAFWAALAGQAAWLAWDQLDDDVRVLVARLVVHEAERFRDRPPDSGVEHDTKAEENAWNSEVIALAACLFPQHPDAAVWRERAIVYMLNSFVRAADRESERVVDGKPVRERLSAVTLHPDFTLENHNRVHPDYLACGTLLLRNASLYRAAGLPVPESTFFNVPETVAVLKRLLAANGSFFYVNGQDWWPHRHDVPLFLGAALAALRQDPEAAYLERAALDITGRMHARFEDGRMWDTREYNYANAEEEMIARYAELFLLHSQFGDGPVPVSREQFVRAQSGVSLYETGGFITHRTPGKFASFTWVNNVMGLVVPDDDTWLMAPYERGLVGRIECDGAADTPAVVEAKTVAPAADGFAVTLRLSRAGGRVGQEVAVVSLPGAPVLYVERLRARQPLAGCRYLTGAIGILNEDAPGLAPNRRTVVHAGGRVEIAGAGPQPDGQLEWATGWANVDGRLGVVSTAGRMAYLVTHRYQRARLEQVLAPVYGVCPGPLAAGQDLGVAAVVLLPGQAATATAATRLELARDGAVVAVRLDGTTVVAANLGEARAQAEVFGQRVDLEPLTTRCLAP